MISPNGTPNRQKALRRVFSVGSVLALLVAIFTSLPGLLSAGYFGPDVQQASCNGRFTINTVVGAPGYGDPISVGKIIKFVVNITNGAPPYTVSLQVGGRNLRTLTGIQANPAVISARASSPGAKTVTVVTQDATGRTCAQTIAFTVRRAPGSTPPTAGTEAPSGSTNWLALKVSNPAVGDATVQLDLKAHKLSSTPLVRRTTRGSPSVVASGGYYTDAFRGSTAVTVSGIVDAPLPAGYRVVVRGPSGVLCQFAAGERTCSSTVSLAAGREYLLSASLEQPANPPAGESVALVVRI